MKLKLGLGEFYTIWPKMDHVYSPTPYIQINPRTAIDI